MQWSVTYEKMLLLTAIALIAAGLILAPILCGSVSFNEYNHSFYFNARTPVMVTSALFVCASAIFFTLIFRGASCRGKKVLPFTLCGGVISFGLFYALAIAYKDAASVLAHYVIVWGNYPGNKEPALQYMPEYIEKFSSISSRYFILMGISAVVIALGFYRTLRRMR